jgi:hypothetical protein
MEIKRNTRWHDFYNKTEFEVVSLLEERLWSLKKSGYHAAQAAGLHGGFWGKFKTGQTSPSRKSLFCFCRALDLPIEFICSFYKKMYKPTHKEITKWEAYGGAHRKKETPISTGSTQSELKILEEIKPIENAEQYDLHCINWLKTRGFKIQKPTTTFHEV